MPENGRLNSGKASIMSVVFRNAALALSTAAAKRVCPVGNIAQVCCPPTLKITPVNLDSNHEIRFLDMIERKRV